MKTWQYLCLYERCLQLYRASYMASPGNPLTHSASIHSYEIMGSFGHKLEYMALLLNINPLL